MSNSSQSQVEKHLQSESIRFHQDEKHRPFPSACSDDPKCPLPFQSLPFNVNLLILEYIDLSKLQQISHLNRLFYSTYLRAKEVRVSLLLREERIQQKYNFANLPLDVWVYEILFRLDYDNVKKMESLSTTLRDLIHNHRALKSQLFRGRVENKSLLKLYQELEKQTSGDGDQVGAEREAAIGGTNQGLTSVGPIALPVPGEASSSSSSSSFSKLKAVTSQNSSFERFKVNLHPSFTSGILKCCLHSTVCNETLSTLQVSGFGSVDDGDEKKVEYFKERADWLLNGHQIGAETATEPAVGWFRFSFEKKGKHHRGTSQRHPAASAMPRAVTVHDVLSKWIELKNPRYLASWYDGSHRMITRRFLAATDETWSPSKEMKARYVNKGNSVGIEIKASLECTEPWNNPHRTLYA